MIKENYTFYHQRNVEKLWDVNLSLSRIRRQEINDRRRYDVLIDVHLMCQRLHLVRQDGHVLLTLEDAVGVFWFRVYIICTCLFLYIRDHFLYNLANTRSGSQ